jgi:four helix bundle protein
MRRAAVSISSNIAESKGDRLTVILLCHARGSFHELETQALIAQQLGYLQGEAAKTVEVLTADRENAEWPDQFEAPKEPTRTLTANQMTDTHTLLCG